MLRDQGFRDAMISTVAWFATPLSCGPKFTLGRPWLPQLKLIAEFILRLSKRHRGDWFRCGSVFSLDSVRVSIFGLNRSPMSSLKGKKQAR
jgi:hypothetical protein